MKSILYSIIICTIFLLFTECSPESKHNQDYSYAKTEGLGMDTNSVILIPIEPVSMDYFPCNDCHSDLIPDPQRRQLFDMHDDIIFDHDSENRWCLACHSLNNRDSLLLASGILLGFDESYKLCGQCHGPKYRDWKLGIHGKRTGQWNGEKKYLLCVHCHNPHSPRFQSLEPLPPPRRPEHIYMDSIYEKQEENPTSP